MAFCRHRRGTTFLHGVRAVLLCDESGRSKRLPPNGLATRFVDRYVPGFARAAPILGTAMVVGLDDEGEYTDVPDDVEHAALGIHAERARATRRKTRTVDGACAPLIHIPLTDGPSTA